MNDDFLKKNNLIEIQSNEFFIVDMMYATPDNITLHPVYKEVGFGNNACVHIDVADKLNKITEVLQRLNLKMRIRDAYRPPIAHQRCIDLMPVKGVFASKPENSLHCYGIAIDCCLTDMKGNNLRFPTEIDAYDKKYARQVAFGKTDEYYKHFEKASINFYSPNLFEEIKNRELLQKIMHDCGFESITSEWWHFQLPNGKEKYKLIEWNSEKETK